jgi:hypothetical protein
MQVSVIILVQAEQIIEQELQLHLWKLQHE